MKTSTMTVNTTEWERVYGVKPGGEGIWQFRFGVKQSSPDFTFIGEFHIATRLALQEAESEGFQRVELLIH